MKRKTVPAHAASRSALIASSVAALFFIFLCMAVSSGRLPFAAPILYVIASAVTFIVYAVDKKAARNRRLRIAENCLHLCSLLGGWPGALVAQQLVRHKTCKLSFQIIFWITVALNAGALGWFFSKNGVDVLCFSSGRCTAGTSEATD